MKRLDSKCQNTLKEVKIVKDGVTRLETKINSKVEEEVIEVNKAGETNSDQLAKINEQVQKSIDNELKKIREENTEANSKDNSEPEVPVVESAPVIDKA